VKLPRLTEEFAPKREICMMAIIGYIELLVVDFSIGIGSFDSCIWKGPRLQSDRNTETSLELPRVTNLISHGRELLLQKATRRRGDEAEAI
jgi:hypothetical protein